MLDDKLSAVIGMQMHRGAKLHFVTETGDGGLPAGVAWTLGYQAEVDQLMAENIADLADEVRCLRRWPAFTLVYFPGPDDVGHFRGRARPSTGSRSGAWTSPSARSCAPSTRAASSIA